MTNMAKQNVPFSVTFYDEDQRRRFIAAWKDKFPRSEVEKYPRQPTVIMQCL